MNNTVVYKRIVVFNVFGHLNGGDAMLLEALYEVLRQTFPEASIEGIAFDPSSERRWMPQMIWHERIANVGQGKQKNRVFQIIHLIIALLLASSRLALPLRRLLPINQRRGVESLVDCDLAISAPGGYFEDSNYAYLLNLVQLLIACRVAQSVILAPQSIGPVRSRLGRACLRFVIERVNRIYIRERWSYDFLARLFSSMPKGRRPVVEKSGDLAFWFKGSDENEANVVAELHEQGLQKGQKLLGMTLVDWNFPGSTDVAQRREDYISAICDLIDHVERRGEHHIIIFNQVASDLPISREVKRRRPSVVVDEGERSSSLLAKMIGASDVFVGTRFHSCIFAMMGHVPTCAISYLPKTTGIMADLGLAEFTVPINNVRGVDLIDRFERLTSDREKISHKIDAAIANYRQTQGRFVDYLKTLSANRVLPKPEDAD